MDNKTIDTPQSSQDVLGGASAPLAPKHPTPEGEGGLGASSDLGSNNVGSKKKKQIVIMVICLLVILVGAVIALMIIKPWEEGVKEEDPSVASGSVDGGNGGDEGDVKDEDGVVEIGVDDELVRGLWEGMRQVESGLYFGAADFYIDEEALAGRPSRDLMMLVALGSFGDEYEGEACQGDYGSSWKSSGCLEGKMLKQKVREIFGKEVDFVDGELLGGLDFCGSLEYNAETDEFHRVGSGCGGAGSMGLARRLVKAEKDDERVYLEELVLAYQGGPDETKVYHVAMPNSGENATILGEEVATRSGNTGIIEEYEEVADRFRWTFVETQDGNYVYEKLERL